MVSPTYTRVILGRDCSTCGFRKFNDLFQGWSVIRSEVYRGAKSNEEHAKHAAENNSYFERVKEVYLMWVPVSKATTKLPLNRVRCNPLFEGLSVKQNNHDRGDSCVSFHCLFNANM